VLAWPSHKTLHTVWKTDDCYFECKKDNANGGGCKHAALAGGKCFLKKDDHLAKWAPRPAETAVIFQYDDGTECGNEGEMKSGSQTFLR